MNAHADGLTYFVVFLFSTTLHEAAHAWAALRGGDPTAYKGGQVTLDPLPHIRREPIGMLVIPLISAITIGWPMGYASAPYDPRWARLHPRRAALMALAGPGANLLLIVLAVLALWSGFAGGIFSAPESVRFGDLIATDAGSSWAVAAKLVSVIFSMNLVLFVFNLLPFPPLDGSAAITLFMDRPTTTKYQEFIWSTPILGWVGILVAWQIFDVVFHPMFIAAVNLVMPGATYG
jgi:Zn-dependent protease